MIPVILKQGESDRQWPEDFGFGISVSLYLILT